MASCSEQSQSEQANQPQQPERKMLPPLPMNGYETFVVENGDEWKFLVFDYKTKHQSVSIQMPFPDGTVWRAFVELSDDGRIVNKSMFNALTNVHNPDITVRGLLSEFCDADLYCVDPPKSEDDMSFGDWLENSRYGMMNDLSYDQLMDLYKSGAR